MVSRIRFDMPVVAIVCALVSACADDAGGGNGGGASNTSGGTSGAAGSPSGNTGTTSGAPTSSASQSGSGVGGGAGDPCAVTLRTSTDPAVADGIALLGIDDTDTIVFGTATALFTLDSVGGTVAKLHDEPGGWGTQNAHMVMSGGYAYVASSSSIVRIAVASGQKEIVSAEGVPGELAIRGSTAWYTNVNGEIRALDLGQPFPLTSTIVAKQGLDYQDGGLAPFDGGLIVLGTVMSTQPAIFRVPLDGSPSTTLYAGPEEYLQGISTDGTSAFVHAHHFTGGLHAGTGRLAVDGSSNGAIEWISDGGGNIFGTNMHNRPPLTRDSVILGVLDDAPGTYSLSRRLLATGETCLLGQHTAGAQLRAAAGPHTFAWYDAAAKAVQWYVLP